MKITHILTAVTSAALFALGASAQAADSIKIGTFLAVTGPAAFLGDPELKTLQLYVDAINHQGGLLGKPVELIHYDTGGQRQGGGQLL
jgi:branched-chain amino acid transport system substrate-binding protein